VRSPMRLLHSRAACLRLTVVFMTQYRQWSII